MKSTNFWDIAGVASIALAIVVIVGAITVGVVNWQNLDTQTKIACIAKGGVYTRDSTCVWSQKEPA